MNGRRSSRRDALRLAAVAGLAPWVPMLTGCDRVVAGLAARGGDALPESLDAPHARTIDPAFALLSRAAFGPWPGDLERVRALGRDAWIEEQLRPDALEDHACDLRSRRFESVFCEAGTAWEFEPAVLRRELAQHALLRAVYTRRQLQEVMVGFWTDHFNVDLGKGDCIHLKPTDDRTVIRPNALGRFRDLVRASVTSGAMLVYLDGAASTGRAPNENHARELLELHTLGVHGGYGQGDVREVARCLTGWTVKLDGFGRGRVAFDPARHDDGPKTVLGTVIPAGLGAGDVDRVVDLVTRHPSTARHVATKLARRFVADEPEPALVELVARAFSESDGDLVPTLRTLLRSEPFQAARATKLKRPFQLVASALRALGADTTAGDDVLERLGRMGQSPFSHPTPDGYPDRADAWTGALLFRIDFAVALARGEIASACVDLPALRRALGTRDAMFGHLLGRAPTSAEARALTDVSSDDLPGVLLASPAFQRC